MGPSARVLGEVQIIADGSAIDLGGSQQRRLLAALLIRRGSTVPTDQLVEAVFHGEPSEAARRSFRTYVSRLRRALQDRGVDARAVVATVASGYSVPATLDVDSVRFEDLLRTARHRLDQGDAEAALRSVEDALLLWSGPAYCEFSDTEWARPEVFRLDELHLVARELHAAAMIESGRHAEAIAEVRALVECEPLREEPRRLLMIALYRAGRHAEALRAAQRYRIELAEETGLEWSRSLAELERRIIARDPQLDAVERGRRLRGYVLGEQLAASSSGVRFRASQPSVGADVVITTVPSVLADDPEFIRRFETHTARIASVEHPGVVAVVDYWREPGAAYLVTPYIAGSTLEVRLRGPDPIDVDTAEHWLRGIGEALSAAAECGLHHGGLTPNDVVLDADGGVHLTGFGLDDRADERSDIVALAELAEQVCRRIDASPWSEGGAAVVALRAVAAAARRAPESTSIGAFVDDLRTAGSAPSTTSDDRARSGDVAKPPNPFRGLHAFAETDTDLFFGRRALVEQLAGDVVQEPFVVLVGPSGSGKSSVVRAGLVPRVRETGAFVATMVPGRHPIAQLELALTRVATSPVPDLAGFLERPGGLLAVLAEVLPGTAPELVLVVDQLEESMTLSISAERDLLFSAMASALRDGDGSLRVVATARADLLGRLLEHPIIGALVRDHTRLIAPLEPSDLHAAIVEPAAAVGVAVEPELASALVADSVDAPGSLPLLQFTLTELFEQASDATMTLDSYRRLGGLGASIASRAEEVYLGLPFGDRAAARRLFSRLITPGEGVEDTRRRASLAELATVPPSVIDRFGSGRLLTFDRDSLTREPTVEVAHEALIRQWPRLSGWVGDDRAGLLVLRHLAASAEAWHRSNGDPAELYRGGRLEAALDWTNVHPDDLTGHEREFVEASQQAREDEAERERRGSRRLHALVVALAALAAGAVVLAALGVVQRQRAEDQRARAEANEVEAERHAATANIERLTAQSVATGQQDSEVAVLLALDAYDQTRALGVEPSGALISAMQTAVQSSRLIDRLDVEWDESAISPDGRTALGAAHFDGEVLAIDIESGAEVRRFETGLRGVGGIVFSPAGDRVLVLEARGSLFVRPRGKVFDARNFEPLGEITESAECCSQTARFSPDGRYLAVGDAAGGGVADHDVVVWATQGLGADPVARFERSQLVGWMPDSETVVLFDGSVIHFRHASSSEAPQRPAMTLGAAQSLDVHPDGDRLLAVRATAENRVTVEVWPLSGDEPPYRFERNKPASGSRGVFSADGSGVVLFGGDDEVHLVSLDTGAVLVLNTRQEVVEGVSAPAAGSPLLVTGDGDTEVWEATAKGHPALGNLPTSGRIDELWFSGDGSRVLVVEAVASPSGPHRRIGDFDLGSARVRRSASTAEGPIVASDELVAIASQDDSAGRVESFDGSVTGAGLGPCDVPQAIDDAGRWLLVASDASTCGFLAGRIVDPLTGEVLAELPDRRVDSADIGRAGTLAEGLLVTRVGIVRDFGGGPPADDVVAHAIEVRRLPDGELVGSIFDDEPDVAPTRATRYLRPRFSADGRHIAIGRDRSGGLLVDVQRLLAGESMREAIVANDGLYLGTTTIADAGGGWLVGRSSSVLRFFDLDLGAVTMTLPLDEGGAFKVTPDGDAIYYADGGVVRRFPLDHTELAALARSMAQEW